MKKKVFALLISLCISIQICVGAVVTIVERDISYSFTKTPGNKVTVESKSSEIKGWSVTSGGILLDETGSFIMPENDVKLVANYEVPSHEYTLTIGVPKFTKVERKTAGTSVTVEVGSSEANKTFSGWTATGITLTSDQQSSSNITFIMPENEVTLEANFTDSI